MDLIFDTHALVWLSVGHPRLSRKLVTQLGREETSAYVSAVTAWEFSDLLNRGRLPTEARIDVLQSDFALTLLDYPADLWQLAAGLPAIHGDPVDRMVIAHAIAVDMTLVSADRTIRRYPVKTLW